MFMLLKIKQQMFFFPAMMLTVIVGVTTHVWFVDQKFDNFACSMLLLFFVVSVQYLILVSSGTRG